MIELTDIATDEAPESTPERPSIPDKDIIVEEMDGGLLRDTETYGTSNTDTSESDDVMSEDPRVERAVAQFRELIRDLLAEERKRTIADMVRGLQSGTVISETASSGAAAPKAVTRHPEAERTTRAPAGSARVLCKRALAEAAEHGLTAVAIFEKRSGPYERMLSKSAVRNELTVGSNLSVPLYKQHGGVWYSAEYAPVGMKIVS